MRRNDATQSIDRRCVMIPQDLTRGEPRERHLLAPAGPEIHFARRTEHEHFDTIERRALGLDAGAEALTIGTAHDRNAGCTSCKRTDPVGGDDHPALDPATIAQRDANHATSSIAFETFRLAVDPASACVARGADHHRVEAQPVDARALAREIATRAMLARHEVDAANRRGFEACECVAQSERCDLRDAGRKDPFATGFVPRELGTIDQCDATSCLSQSQRRRTPCRPRADDGDVHTLHAPERVHRDTRSRDGERAHALARTAEASSKLRCTEQRGVYNHRMTRRLRHSAAIAFASMLGAHGCRDRTNSQARVPSPPALDTRAPEPARVDSAVITDVAITDATDGDAVAPTAEPLCPMRSFPPEELSIGAAPDSSASVIWNGREWGVAWSEVVTGEATVFFARVDANGHRVGNPSRVSDRGYRGAVPSLLWNGQSWGIAYSGGASRLEEIWYAQLDARGSAQGRPRRLTARNRRDYSPAIASNGHDTIAVWSTQLPDDRWGILAMRIDRWGTQIGAPILIADRRERLSAPSVVWNGFAWAAAWLVSRTEAIAVDMVRIEADVSRARGYPVRVTIGPLGGTDQGARFGFAWDGEQYAVVWDEVRDGAPHAFFETIGRLLEPRGRGAMLSPTGDSATAPSVLAMGGSTFLAAWVVERGRERHVQIATVDGAANPLAEHIEVQSNDGMASMPAMALGERALGIATISARGVSFHRVPLGPCPTH